MLRIGNKMDMVNFEKVIQVTRVDVKTLQGCFESQKNRLQLY